MDDRSHRPQQRDEDAIRAIEAAYDRAWNAGDVGGLTSAFQPDASILDPFGGVSSGREEIRRLLAELLSGPGSASTHASTILAVTFVTEDVALADGEALIEGLRGGDGEAAAPVRHRFTDVFLRTHEGWRIAHVRAYVYLDGPRP